jgi:hypothetical protein
VPRKSAAAFVVTLARDVDKYPNRGAELASTLIGPEQEKRAEDSG